MTVFKTFLKVLNKNKFIVILYSVILLFFGVSNMQTQEENTNFISSKPDVLLVVSDELEGITKHFVDYMEKHTNRKEIEESVRDDALFYRDVNYIIFINDHFREDFLSGEQPNIEVKSTGDYQASLAELLVNNYLKVASVYQKMGFTEEEIMQNIDKTLEKQVVMEVTSPLDTDQLEKVAFYYNFLSYSMLAGCVYIICLMLVSFQNEKIRKRTIISSMSDRKYNRILLLSNGLFALLLWLCYVVLSFILLGEGMFSRQGFLMLINSFLFTICCLTLAFLLGTLIRSKNTINGIVNVVALGSSFLCGAFVPMEWLPNFVLKIAHLLPSYWYIKTNELLKTMEIINIESLKPIFYPMGILCFFSVFFVILTNYISSKRRNIG